MNCIELRTEIFWILDYFGGLTIFHFISIYIYIYIKHLFSRFDPKLALLQVIYFDVLVVQGLSAALLSWAVPASRPQWMAMLRTELYVRRHPTTANVEPRRTSILGFQGRNLCCLGMCEVCTEAVHSVALWTRTLSRVWACVKYVPTANVPPARLKHMVMSNMRQKTNAKIAVSLCSSTANVEPCGQCYIPED